LQVAALPEAAGPLKEEFALTLEAHRDARQNAGDQRPQSVWLQPPSVRDTALSSCHGLRRVGHIGRVYRINALPTAV
jgi:hypothetical protein